MMEQHFGSVFDGLGFVDSSRRIKWDQTAHMGGLAFSSLIRWSS